VSGSTRCVQLLLDAGAQVGAQDLNGLMPIHVAAGSGHPEVIKRRAVDWLDRHCDELTDWDTHTHGYVRPLIGLDA